MHNGEMGDEMGITGGGYLVKREVGACRDVKDQGIINAR